MKAMSNFVDRANSAIYDFVHLRRNQRLLLGTGTFSVPFRGTLFNETNSDEISEKLRSQRADVLWMGSNPNAPNSLAAILGKPGFPSDINGFERQMASGKYSEHVWTKNGEIKLGWDPIHNATQSGWVFYRDVLNSIADLSKVAMSNFVVWGSSTFDELLSEIARIDPSLLNRLLQFSIDLNQEIILSLRPRLVIVPLSLGRNKILEQNYSSLLTLSHNRNTREYRVPVGSRSFYYYVREHQIETLKFPVLYVPHPSSIRLSNEHKNCVRDAIGGRFGASSRLTAFEPAVD
jgi:hypothetical protein